MIGELARARRLLRRATNDWRRGDRERAQRRAVRALSIIEAGARPSGVADHVHALVVLARFAAELAEHAEAEGRYAQAVAALRAAPAGVPGHAAWLSEALVGCGTSARLAGRYERARACLDDALQVADQLPDDPLRRGWTHNALGVLAKDLGRYDEAATHYATARDLVEPALGPESPQLAALHHNLAGLAHAQGHDARAEAPARLALALRRSADPPDEAGVAADLSVLGAVLAGRQRFDGAERCFVDAIGLWRIHAGADHYEVAVNLHNLAALQHALGRHDAAEENFGAALRIKRRVLGDEHPEVGAILNNLGALQADRGRPEEARRLYDEALDILRRALGPDHPSTRTCAESRARLGPP